jgi:hypothetical protein
MKKPSRSPRELPLVERWDGTAESKAKLHKDAQAVLWAVAEELGLKKDEFRVRSNEMGPAIGGAIYLETRALRIWIEGGYGFAAWGSKPRDSSGQVDSYVIVRRYEDGKDVDYDHDLVVDWELLWDPKMFVAVLKIEGLVR